MELAIFEQIFEQIKKSQKVLIALPENLTTDSLSSGLAMWMFLNKLKKDVVVVSSGQPGSNLKFLPNLAVLQKHLKSGNSLVISLNTATKKLDEISYQVSEEEQNVRVYLKSKNSEFTKEDISYSVEKFPVDLIITLGAKSLEDLGLLIEQSADIFFETPKVNIDTKTDNEYFGQLNLVDVTATSVAEILAELLQKYEENLVDEDMATCLLAGIIEKTGSFQHVHTTPKSFLKASELVALGARQQEVIKHIYKTKPLSLLKLWGRTLARMKINEDKKVVYSLLNQNDFEKAQSDFNDLMPTLVEFVDNLNDYKIVAILAEGSNGQIKFLAAVHNQIIPENLAVKFGGKILEKNIGGYKIIEQNLTSGNLEDLEKVFLESVNEIKIK
jgi:nanoRNase/pAp phosphatase (c-di-AMP/oligoRNAs hydrolase)